jgi:hypothetical protein
MTFQKFALAVPVLLSLSLPLAQARGKANFGGPADDSRQTLKDMRISALAVENEAAELTGIIAQPQSSPESTLSRLIVLKDEVNKMGKELSRLEAERQALPDWEQRAVDKTLPLLQATAANTQGVIEFYNDNRSHLWTAAGRGYADRIYDESKQIAATLHDYLKYDKLSRQEHRLSQDLAASTSELGL